MVGTAVRPVVSRRKSGNSTDHEEAADKLVYSVSAHWRYTRLHLDLPSRASVQRVSEEEQRSGSAPKRAYTGQLMAV